MSKVVRSVGKVVKGAVKAVKKFAKSKIGKMILVAAAAFFVGPAVLGAFGASGAAAAGGLSGISGAVANVSAAWTGLGEAAGSALAGNFSEAVGQFSTAAAGGSATPLSTATTPQAIEQAAAAGSGSAPTLTQQAVSQAVSTGSKALINGSMAGPVNTGGDLAPNASQIPTGGYYDPNKQPGFSLKDYMAGSDRTGAALVQAGGQLVAGVGQGISQQAAVNEQNKRAAADRARYNANMGTSLWNQGA